MKKTLSILFAVLLLLGCFSACSTSDVTQKETDKMQIVTTIFPLYDWVSSVLGEKGANAEVTMLLDNGVDLHSYQPTADDILKISTCDLFIYVGGESDEWVEDALIEATNSNMIVLNLVEGMQEEEHDHEHEEDDHDEDHAHEHEEGETEYDEHIWLSLKNATVLVSSISDAIRTIDPDNAESYKKNASAYIEKLNALDAKYRAAVDSAAVKTVLFGDRFPFRYLTDDYGLTYYAAFVGCSAETEASFETITFLSQKVDELSLPAVLTIEGKDHRIAETIVRNTKTKDQIILTMDSMQGTTAKDVRNGVTYLSIMEKNLEVLENAIH